MKREKISFLITSTGESDLMVFEDETLTPDDFEFTISARSGVNETHIIFSTGSQDMVLDRKSSHSIYGDSSVRGTRRSTSESITHWKSVSGTLTKIIGAYVSHVEAGGFKIMASAANSNFVVDGWAIQR